MVRECREALQQAIEVRKFYHEKIEVIASGDPAKLEQVEGDIAPFEEDLRSVLEVREGRREQDERGRGCGACWREGSLGVGSKDMFILH